MKSRRKKILLFVILLLVGANIVPFITPIRVKSILTDYEYMIYGAHAEITQYRGGATDIKIPCRFWGRKVTRVCARAFQENSEIEIVELPKYLKEIGYDAFAYCENLREIKGGNALEKIEEAAFWYCDALTKIQLPDRLEVIGDLAFYETGLEAITIPESVTHIGKLAFADTQLKEVNYMGNKAFIGERAFANTPWLSEQNGHVICGDRVLIASKSEDMEVVIPNGVKYICTSSESFPAGSTVYLPETVEYIDDYVFAHCKDVTVYIPASVKEIGKYKLVIEGDENLTFVTTPDSYASTYALVNGINCEIVDEIIYPEE